MEVYKSKYLHIAFLAGQQLLEATWLSETKMMDTEECKQEFLSYLDVVRQQRPKGIVVDTQNMFFPLSAKLQDWINQTILPPLLNIGVKKTAFVTSNDFFAQLSTKQVMMEMEGLKRMEYFNNKDVARKWVLSAA
ncbi:MAG: hypothetical protein PHU06_04460 [Gallionella sp.]|nr:hypothetical protein [Gallionella sp.]MDD4957933.1 hypothetical protein [Gallionella sp.]